MKTSMLFSALALASAAIALPHDASQAAPSYESGTVDNTGESITSPDRQRPDSYNGKHQQNGIPQVQGNPESQSEVDAVPGPNPGSNRQPRPKSYGQDQSVHVEQGGVPPKDDDNENNGVTQDHTRPRPHSYSNNNDNNNNIQPGQNQFSPQQNTHHRVAPNQGEGQNQNRPQSYNSNNNRPGQTQSSPQDNFGPGPSSGQCVSQQEANEFVRRFSGILNRQGSDIGDAQATAEQIIAHDFLEISSSINTITGESEGNPDSVVARSGEEWTQHILHAPRFGGIQTLKVLVFCDQVVWYWNFAAVGSGQFPIKGFNLFTLRRAGSSNSGHRSSGTPGPTSDISSGSSIQCTKLEVEFDSLANALDTGFQCTNRAGEQIQTTSGQGGARGGMAHFQNSRPHGQSQQGDDTQSFYPKSPQGGQPGRGNLQNLQDSQQQDDGAGRKNSKAGE